ncbi:MAG TPA: hypothetical protein VJ208_01030 [Candidatus Nanoarchaeia archaeon]|nr:hypothetical protein [Candidatus Nanoarchaeia archaeon]
MDEKKGSFKRKKYFITSAQACASPHRNFLEGVERYAEGKK